jgi:hypothetical protein
MVPGLGHLRCWCWRTGLATLPHGVAFLCGFDTPSLSAQGRQRRLESFNFGWDIPFPITAALSPADQRRRPTDPVATATSRSRLAPSLPSNIMIARSPLCFRQDKHLGGRRYTRASEHRLRLSSNPRSDWLMERIAVLIGGGRDHATRPRRQGSPVPAGVADQRTVRSELLVRRTRPWRARSRRAASTAACVGGGRKARSHHSRMPRDVSAAPG